MRQYGPIWIKLKKDKCVSVTANRRHHARIAKAVAKEKWLDKGYKIIIQPKIAVLSARSSAAILTFTLTERVPTVEMWRYL